MSNKLLILTTFSILCFLSFLFFSCKSEIKKEAVILNNSATKQVIRINYADDPDGIKQFEYDEDGNVIRMIQAGDTAIFTYSATMITKRHTNLKVHWDAGTDYVLDAGGRIISAKILGAGDTIISNFKYSYNADGYLSKIYREVVASKSITFNEFTYKDGNMIHMNEKNADGSVMSNYVCEYYPDKVMNQNIFVQTFIEDIISNGRFGKMSKNFVKNSYSISIQGDTMSHLNYTYENITEPKSMNMMETDVNNGFKMPVTYWYK